MKSIRVSMFWIESHSVRWNSESQMGFDLELFYNKFVCHKDSIVLLGLMAFHLTNTLNDCNVYLLRDEFGIPKDLYII